MASLILRPLSGAYVDAERKRVLQRLDSDFDLELGRAGSPSTAGWGILSDPRVSRKHVRLRGGPTVAPYVTALGTNPCALIKANGGERLILKQGECAALSSGDELHLVVEEVQRAKGASLPWLGSKSAYFVGLSSTALALTPTDGRQQVVISGKGAIGRAHAEGGLADSWVWGIRDPRVSRNHARFEEGIGETYTVYALSAPMQIVAADGRGTVVRKGGAALLHAGDCLHLLHLIPASGASLPFAGNSCAWRVELFVKPRLLLRPIGSTNGEVVECRNDVELRGAGASITIGSA